MKQKSRRDFVKLSGLTLATALVPLSNTGAGVLKKKNELKLGLASYSLRKFSQTQALEMTKRVGLDYICFKSMHLAMDASTEELKSSAINAKKTGVNLYGAGVIYMKTKEDVDQAFEYAINAGISVIVGVPQHDLLSYTNDKIKEYNIKVAIHNHGPGDEQYPSPESVFEKIKDLDPRFGLCMDIGHTQRIGVDPIEAGKAYFSRLFDIHLKDVNSATPDGKTVEIGRGVIDIPGFLEMLLNKGYTGVAGIEYEKDADDPLPGLSESVGYVKGCIKVLSQ
ncbi:sugar phosphate isomerase/epimerase family protein [Reichenbachiella sp. MALMAid0571]|uniref:sugar phosphate isomerase/epimerase family protein n=1 Tax=Reichenbachiella sp. MALMAid0571 TaxID=3143939 RepID=UPI0032DF0145